MAGVFAEWLSTLFRLRVVITLDDLRGKTATTIVEHPDKPVAAATLGKA